MIQPVEECKCKGPEPGERWFFCPHHQCRKTKQWHELCRSRANYRTAWNEGRMPGQLGWADRLEVPAEDKEPKPPEGVGTELKRLLGYFGIRATPGCPCPARIREMNSRGIQWCERNIDTIVGWMAEEAERRKMKLVFVKPVAQQIVKLAIRLAKKKEKRKKKEIADAI